MRIAAYPNKIGVAVPTRDYVYVHMVRQSRTGASAEIDTDIEAVRLYCKSQHFLGVPHQFCHFEKLFVICLFEIGYVPDRCDKQVAIVIGEAIKHCNTVFGAPQDKIFVVVLRGFDVSADKALTFIGKTLNIPDSPRCP